MTEKEVRSISSTLELRSAEGSEKEVITGYALKFNRWSSVLGGWFKEIIDPRALDQADMSNVVALFNHDESEVLARTGINLKLDVDDIGLRFEFTPNGTTYAKDLLENIRSGIITQCSFAFTIPNERDSEEWADGEDGIMERRIKRFDKIYDVSAVTTPAYPDTDVVVGARSKELAESITQQKVLQSLEEQRELESLEIEYSYITQN